MSALITGVSAGSGFAGVSLVGPLVWRLVGLVRPRPLPGAVYATFGTDAAPVGDGVELLPCPEHGITAHRVREGAAARCWDCIGTKEGRRSCSR